MDKTSGMVLRTVDFSETSKIVTLFTRDFGKLGAMAKGGRRLKSGFQLALDSFSVCDIGLIRKSSADLDLLTEAVLVERFTGLQSNLSALYAAYYLAEILDGFLQTDDPHPGLYDITLASLRALANGGDRDLLLAQFQSSLLRELGFGLNLERCASCAAEVPLALGVDMGIAAGGLLCVACASRGQERLVVQGATIQVLRHLEQSQEVIPRGLVVNKQTRGELWQVLGGSVRHWLGRPPRMARLLYRS